MDAEIQQINDLCSVSTRMVAKTFFHERFNLEFAEPVHGKIFDLIDDPEKKKVAIAAPRGWGKTSIVALALMARFILYRICPFIVYINKSETAAIMQTENLKRELMTNPDIRRIFGTVKPHKVGKNEMEEQFSKKAWVAYDTFILPRGAGQQVRGVIFRNDRPGLIIIDDLEDKKKVLNPDLREELETWLHADVLEAIPQLHMNWKIVYIDTLKHEAALLQHVLDAEDWDSVRLESCDDNLKSVAPHFVSNEAIAEKWDIAVKSGQTDTFFQEHRNLPISSKDSAFQQKYFHYYNLPHDAGKTDQDLLLMDSDVQHDKNVENVVLLDPAKTVKIHSAESAILGLGLDMVKARIYVRDIVSEKMYPDEIYDEMFGMAKRLNAKVIGIEETSLNEFIKQPIKNEMFRRGDFYELIWLQARGGIGTEKGKTLRVKELVPFYRQGYIFHNKMLAGTTRLEQQLLMFPRSALWDIMDCLAYVIQMMEKGARYFAVDADPEDSEAQFAELKYEKPLEHWRSI